MKKMITLLIAVVAVSSVFAQTAEEKARARDKVFGNHKNGQYPSSYPGSYPNSYPQTYPGNYPSGSSQQAQIDQINRDYDAKIYSVQNNPYLSPAEKDRQIRQLNNERNRRIQQITQNGYGSNNHRKYKKHHDDDDDDDRGNGRGYGKNNNPGKHLGWEKGRGNPHKGQGNNWRD